MTVEKCGCKWGVGLVTWTNIFLSLHQLEDNQLCPSQEPFLITGHLQKNLKLLYIVTLIGETSHPHFSLSLFNFWKIWLDIFFFFKGGKKCFHLSIFLISTSLPNYWNFSCMHFWSVCCCYMCDVSKHICFPFVCKLTS